MSGDILTQRNSFETRVFQIKENGVQFTIKNLLRSESFLVPYENIPVEPYEFSRLSRGSFYLIFFSLIFGVWSLAGIVFGNARLWVVFIPMLAILLMRFLFFRQCFVSYGYEKSPKVIFFKDKPNKDIFDDFVHQMQLKKNSYLREIYLVFQFNPNNPAHFQTLHWLKKMGAMKQEEVERLIKDSNNI